jgi:hypothetical protein
MKEANRESQADRVSEIPGHASPSGERIEPSGLIRGGHWAEGDDRFLRG